MFARIDVDFHPFVRMCTTSHRYSFSMSTAPEPETHDVSVLLLTGGTSRRMGTDKASLRFGAGTLLDFVLGRVPAGIHTVVVGPNSGHPVQFVREDPPGSGPVAAVTAGLACVSTSHVAVAAVDVPLAIPWLLTVGLKSNSSALIPRDADGRAHPLNALYDVKALRDGLQAMGSPTNQSMQSLIAHLKNIEYVQASETSIGEQLLLDVNTPADLERAATLLQP
jgi:molybdopterin-guanine dinucleotide biosynthesis protein A